MDKGFGKLSFFYSSIFNGSELLSLKPKEFEESRYQHFEESLSNPKNFSTFFNVVDKNAEKLDKKREISFENIDNLNLVFFRIKNREILRENIENFENFIINPPNSLKKDFSYSPLGVFFKSEFLIYEQVFISLPLFL